jgi:endonuclease/exonuclease/phosphatase family metal-dependent hydrolase
MYRPPIVYGMVRALGERSASSAALLVAAVGSALVLVLTGCSQSSGTAAIASSRKGSTYTLMQMNLCLSGLGGCYGKVDYPAGVDEATTRIGEVRPDAVTLNEVCRSDVARIARRTAYHLRFSGVIYHGKPLACVRPGGRGLFGDAVLTRAAIDGADNEDFTGQAGPERRRWLCVTTRVAVDVCTAHLNTLSAIEAGGNAKQCAELRALLTRRASARTVIFGGDVNRRRSCAPGGVWTRTDRSAHQAPGLQHVYGSRALRSPAAEVVPAASTDHDLLLVRARLPARR